MRDSKIITWLVVGFLCLVLIGVADMALGLISGVLSLAVGLVSGLLSLAFSKVGLTLILIAFIVYTVSNRNPRSERYRYY